MAKMGALIDELVQRDQTPLLSVANGPNDPGDGVRRPGWFWLFLFGICFIPRLLLWIQYHAYCQDAYFYIFLGDQLDRGNFNPLIEYYDINIYPFILLLGHKIGLSWTAAGVSWGILVGSLTVLPLHGWLKRVANERIALCGCLLYASHPNLLELSVEPIRDTTFWFFLNLTLYFALRAAQEARVRYYLAAGLSWALSAYTRTEGWLLFVPLSIWILNQGFVWPGKRLRTLAGSLGLMGMIPLFVVVVNYTAFPHESTWHPGSLRHFQTVWTWAKHQASGPPSQTVALPVQESTEANTTGNETTEKRGPQKPQTTFPEQVEKTGSPMISDMVYYLKKLHHAVEPLHYLLLGLGFCVGWKQIWNHRILPLILLALVQGLAIWILTNTYNAINSRYFLTAYLLCLPIESLGLLCLIHYVQRTRNLEFSSPKHAPRVGLAVVVTLFVIGWVDALVYIHPSRHRELEFTHWLRMSPYSSAEIAVDAGARRIGYHLKDTMPPVLASPWDLATFRPENPPEIVIVSKHLLPPEKFSEFQQHASHCDYDPIPNLSFPSSERFAVFVCKDFIAKRDLPRDP